MTYKELKENIKKAGLTIKEFAEIIGSHPNSVTNLKQKSSIPKNIAIISILMAELAVRDVNIQQLLTKNKDKEITMERYKNPAMEIYDIAMKSLQKRKDKDAKEFSEYMKSSKKLVEKHIELLSNQHIEQIEKKGFMYSLDKIFIEEVAKYYEIIIGISKEETREYLLKKIKSLKNEDEKQKENKILLYPTFEYNELNDGTIVETIPTVTAVAINGDNFQYLGKKNTAPKRIDTLDGLVKSLTTTHNEIAEYCIGKFNIKKEDEDRLFSLIQHFFSRSDIKETSVLYDGFIEEFLHTLRKKETKDA